LLSFSVAEPKLEVRLAASTEYARFSNDDFDIDVVYGQPRGEGNEIIPLGEETVTPLCTGHRKRIRKPKDLFGRSAHPVGRQTGSVASMVRGQRPWIAGDPRDAFRPQLSCDCDGFERSWRDSQIDTACRA
jgi:hypothetical protein